MPCHVLEYIDICTHSMIAWKCSCSQSLLNVLVIYYLYSKGCFKYCILCPRPEAASSAVSRLPCRSHGDTETPLCFQTAPTLSSWPTIPSVRLQASPTIPPHAAVRPRTSACAYPAPHPVRGGSTATHARTSRCRRRRGGYLGLHPALRAGGGAWIRIRIARAAAGVRGRWMCPRRRGSSLEEVHVELAAYWRDRTWSRAQAGNLVGGIWTSNWVCTWTSMCPSPSPWTSYSVPHRGGTSSSPLPGSCIHPIPPPPLGSLDGAPPGPADPG